ncbi:hypothetical protein PsorP6_005388 [Peronosclerospora sorghi]|uniref:Uncharacterized protein n=1 Tax=Peronosclerospora sorghi TaxID=230839 RepID=A0ACC0W717_9STRA|nr:hypothetical protein PsorP6_005388 [Peronosclerospora sorghi]
MLVSDLMKITYLHMTPTLLLWLLCFCAGLGAYLSATGLLRLNEVFFQSASATSNWDNQNTTFDELEKVEAVYDRLVVVLIDALRADMVLGSASMHDNKEGNRYQAKEELNIHMPFTSGLVTSGKALGYVAHASIPTVTMPRLKALVTGKAPAFIDILKNFNSASLDNDANLVSLLAASGKRIVFYGDDTWLKLFPTSFKRSDGTSGFYARDTVEVDINVTRHLREELDTTMQNEKSSDWDALVLHYLGLDHVGHLRGPRSSLMQEKLHEMDEVVHVVVDSVQEQDARRMRNDNSARPSLIVLCSDHGMSEIGNHGGATIEESSALLMFMRGDGEPMNSSSDHPVTQKRSQVDLVPTISSLFGLPIPLYSTGLLLGDVIIASPGSPGRRGLNYLRALYRNFRQLYALAKIKLHASTMLPFGRQYEELMTKLHWYLDADEENVHISHPTVTAVLDACEMLHAKVVLSDGSEYNGTAIFHGLLLLFFSSVTAVTKLATSLKESTEVNVKHDTKCRLLTVVGVGGILQIVSLSSSSSIENEHATSFFVTSSFLVVLWVEFLRLDKVKSAWSNTFRPRVGLAVISLLLVVTRALRARNQVINFWRLNGLHVDTNLPGNEFAEDDSVSILSTAPILPSTMLPLSICVIFVSGLVLRKAALHSRSALMKQSLLEFSNCACSGLLFLVGMLACLKAKELSDQTAVNEAASTRSGAWDADRCARVVYACVVFISVLVGLSGRCLRLLLVEMIVWLLVCLLQRDANFPTLCLVGIQMELVAKLLNYIECAAIRHNGILMAALALWLSQTAFFALGNSHLVTTVDISQSYHGLSTYSQSLVGVMTFISVFSGPLVCFVNLAQWLHITAPVRTSTLSTKSINRKTWMVCLAILVYQTFRFAFYTYVIRKRCWLKRC